MGLDLSGPAFEVAIGLAFVFFLLSTVVSAITEGLAWFTKQRAKQLEQGLFGLLGENRFALDLLKHSLVQSDARTRPAESRKRGKSKKRPSYLSAKNFSLALSDLLAKRGAPEDALQGGGSVATLSLDNIRAGATRFLGEKEGALKSQLTVLLGDPTVKDLQHFRGSAEQWFDDAMDRVSGWYKRWAQWITCVIAVVVTIAFNINAVRITETLANEPTVRAAVAGKAESVGRAADATVAGEGAESAAKTLDSLQLPILWNDATDDFNATLVVGWLITAIAISLGAPFWFDALGKLAHLRTTGKKPDPKTEGTG